MSATVVSFGEWLPDQPDLNGQGLITANNILPLDAGYGPFRPLDTSLATVPAGVENGFFAYGTTGYVYANVSGLMYSAALYGAFASRGTISAGRVSYTQFDDKVVTVNTGQQPLLHTLGSASNFSTLSAATLPSAGCIGVVNRFVVIGNIQDGTSVSTASIRWSGIDNITSWPTPNSATAIAQQSGIQYLNVANGEVMAIHGGDQFSVIIQRHALTRMTYVGPPVVFQFDLFDNTKGQYFPRGSIKVGNLIYFLSDSGLCRTDGVSVERIGFGKVDQYFWTTIYLEATAGNEYHPNLGYEPSTGLIYIGFPTNVSSAGIDTILIFNPATSKFTSAQQNLECFLTPSSIPQLSQPTVTMPHLLGLGIQANSVLGKFAATAGTATIATSDMELNPGGRAYVDGVKPNVESSGTAPAVTVRVGARNDLSTTPSYTATTTPTTRTGFADFRVDAKYHRAEVQIVGNFQKATGIEFKAFLTGEA